MKTFFIQGEQSKGYSWKSRRIGEIASRFIGKDKNLKDCEMVNFCIGRRHPDCRLKSIYKS